MGFHTKHVLALGILVSWGLLFAGMAAAGGAKPPPAIEDIAGEWEFSGKGALYDFGVAKPVKRTWSERSEIVVTGPHEVHIWSRRAHYLNGVLLIGAGDTSGIPSTEVAVMCFVITGAPGKLKLTGKEFWYVPASRQMGTWNYSATQSSSGSPVVPRAPAQVATMAANKASAPPTINDLDGAVLRIGVSSVEYDLLTGGKESSKEAPTWTITKIGATTVNIHHVISTYAMDFQGTYEDGMLVVGSLDDSTLAANALFIYGLVSGSPGKIAIKGEFISYEVGSDGVAEVGKFSGKQTAP
jgi:hypothetical protein